MDPLMPGSSLTFFAEDVQLRQTMKKENEMAGYVFQYGWLPASFLVHCVSTRALPRDVEGELEKLPPEPESPSLRCFRDLQARSPAAVAASGGYLRGFRQSFGNYPHCTHLGLKFCVFLSRNPHISPVGHCVPQSCNESTLSDSDMLLDSNLVYDWVYCGEGSSFIVSSFFSCFLVFFCSVALFLPSFFFDVYVLLDCYLWYRLFCFLVCISKLCSSAAGSQCVVDLICVGIMATVSCTCHCFPQA
eukprot:m.257637 g.257637  ORF g.257637 m.257637 type:complete len:246 (-) comp26757_c1_seq28:1354-2091(-)